MAQQNARGLLLLCAVTLFSGSTLAQGVDAYSASCLHLRYRTCEGVRASKQYTAQARAVAASPQTQAQSYTMVTRASHGEYGAQDKNGWSCPATGYVTIQALGKLLFRYNGKNLSYGCVAVSTPALQANCPAGFSTAPASHLLPATTKMCDLPSDNSVEEQFRGDNLNTPKDCWNFALAGPGVQDCRAALASPLQLSDILARETTLRKRELELCQRIAKDPTKCPSAVPQADVLP